MPYVENILSVFERASDNDVQEGLDWYRAAQALALELSPGNVWRGAGVISALSPLKKWDLNVRLARNAFETGIATGNIGQHNEKAQRILDGELALDVLRGDKTRSFAEAIATAGNGRIATIDRHAHDIAMGRVFNEGERKIGKRIYREMAQAYADAADSVSISVNGIQAATWIVWRREKGIS